MTPSRVLIASLLLTCASGDFTVGSIMGHMKGARVLASERLLSDDGIMTSLMSDPDVMICITKIMAEPGCETFFADASSSTGNSSGPEPKCIGAVTNCLVGDCFRSFGAFGELMMCGATMSTIGEDGSDDRPGFADVSNPTSAECSAVIADDPSKVCMALISPEDVTKAALVETGTKMMAFALNPKCALIAGMLNMSGSDSGSDSDSCGGDSGDNSGSQLVNITDENFGEMTQELTVMYKCKGLNPTEFAAMQTAFANPNEDDVNKAMILIHSVFFATLLVVAGVFN